MVYHEKSLSSQGRKAYFRGTTLIADKRPLSLDNGSPVQTYYAFRNENSRVIFVWKAWPDSHLYGLSVQNLIQTTDPFIVYID
jgi:hypothetical protein